MIAMLGATLHGLAVSNDGETTLRLDVGNWPKEPLYLTTSGDCCSESWWADVTGAAGAYGGELLAIRKLDLPNPDDDRSRQECDLAYGYELTTSKGVVTMVFRNSSNGYYGGEAELTTEPPDAGWTKITTNDWRA